MTFAFYLFSPQKGVSRGKQKETPLRLIVSSNGRKYKKFIGISVLPDDFKKQRTKDEKINEKLKAIENYLNTKLDPYSTGDEIKAAMDDALKLAFRATGKGEKENEPKAVYTDKTGIDSKGAPTFWEYFHEWAGRDVPSKRQRKNICSLIGRLMGEQDGWKDIDTAYYFRLTQKMNADGYAVNYQGSVISRLKSVMSEGYKLKYHTNADYHQFTRRSEQPDTIYLTKKELDALWELELKDPMEQRVRDLFLIGCYTAMRFSDYSRITMENIKGGYIYSTQKKTAGSVIVPASPRVLAILKRNGGAAPAVNQIVFNREIKTVCCRAKINEKVEVTKSKGDRHVTELQPKYKLVSSHTARRTGCTLMYQSGVPASRVMLISGHKSESAFMRYIRTGKEENARAMASNPFFK